MKKKNIVFMTCFEQAPDVLDYKEWCLKSWNVWCKKHDVELFVLSDELRDKLIMKPTWQRWHVFEILDANEINYNQVALVDVDTMIHPEAPNFFDETKGEYSGVQDDLMVEWVHNSIVGYQDLFPNTKFDWTTYMNNGFIVMSPKHKKLCKTITDFYYANEDELRDRQHNTLKKGSDQTPVNYLVRREGYPITHLSKKWNFTQLHQRGVLHQAMFIDCAWMWHFNGFDKTMRNKLMQDTWNILKQKFKLDD